MAIVNSYTGNMPTPDRTSRDAIVVAACDLLETEGLAGLTMHAVAQRVGVRTPSLYKRVQSRDALIQLVAEATLTAVGERMAAGGSPVELANILRAIGHERPAAFQLVMTPGAGTPVADRAVAAAASEPLLRAAAELAGAEHALEAARTVMAWATGFISMELNGTFQLGGDLDRAWDFGLRRILAALAVGGASEPKHSGAPRP
jgi:AcrR family transcriptional regulator